MLCWTQFLSDNNRLTIYVESFLFLVSSSQTDATKIKRALISCYNIYKTRSMNCILAKVSYKQQSCPKSVLRAAELSEKCSTCIQDTKIHQNTPTHTHQNTSKYLQIKFCHEKTPNYIKIPSFYTKIHHFTQIYSNITRKYPNVSKRTQK